MSKKSPQLRFEGFTDDWEERKLSGIIEKLSGGASIKPTDYLEDGIRTIPKGAVNATGIAGLSGSKYISEDFFEKNITSHAHTSNLVTSLRDLVPSAPNMGRIVRIEGVDEQFLMPQGVYKLELFEGMDEDFLISFSNSDKYRKIISAEKNGSTQVHIRNGEFLNIDINLPSEHEQKKIGSFFKQLDNTIALHQRKLDLLKEQKKGYLQKMFPKNGAKVPELRFAGFADDWEERKLSSGLREYTDRVIVEDDKEYYQISVRNNFGGITLRGSKMGNKIGRKRQAKINLTKYPQTLIFTRQTVEQGGIGWVDKYCDGAIVTENMPTISLDTSVFSKYFLTNLFQTRIFYKNAILDNVEGGSAQIAIHESKFLSSTLLFPNLDEQEKIGQFFKQLDDTIDLHQRKLDLLKEQKKGFLHKMFV